MAESPRIAVVLAGGLGTRLRSVVADRPKPMAMVAGRPFLEHLLGYWHAWGVERFVLSIGYRHEFIEAHFGHRFAGCRIDYVVEPGPLGTGGALLLCRRQLQLAEPFLLLNGDTFFAVDPVLLHRQAVRHDADWGLSLFPTNDTRRYLAAGLDEAGRLSFDPGAGARVEGSGPNWANGGVYWVHPRALAPFGDRVHEVSLESGLFPECQARGQVFCGLRSEATFIDIGIPEDYARAQTMPCFLQPQE